MFKELDVVKTVVAIPKVGIAVGDLGTIVDVVNKPSRAYLVEFANDQGETLAMEFLDSTQFVMDTPARVV
jgi:hypothetical protein